MDLFARSVCCAIVLVALAAPAARPGAADPRPAVTPFEQAAAFRPADTIDLLVLERLGEVGLTPAGPCSDAVFLRRVHLDATGTLPTAEQVRRFLRDDSPDKRAKLIDDLLADESFADYWAMKWSDVLRVKAEHPINLWPNGVQAYHRWIRQSLAENKPYDRFARELLTSSGSNFRVPPVNFYRAVQGHEPSAIASAAGLTFMGVRVERWPTERRQQLEAFFSRVAFKPTAEWKEEIVYLDPAPAAGFEGVLPDGRRVRVEAGDDPRLVFADWLIADDNPYFARAAANRVWAWLFGRGIVEEPDDFRDDNPPSHPKLLDHLADELVGHDYDLKHLYRLILNSQTYQQSSIPRSDDPRSAAMFACYPVRRLDAEVLIDALVGIFGPTERYESPIPEPFTFIPEEQATVTLADGSITSPFLELFGRPSRDTGLMSERNNDPTDAQRLHLLNSSHVQGKIEQSWRMRQMLTAARGDHGRIIEPMYLAILSRPPTEAETKAVRDYIAAGKLSPRDAATDLAWALINTKEFLYRH